MTLVAIFVFIFYFALLGYIFYGWKKVMSSKQPVNPGEQSISVILPVRNEERHIASILKDLTRQQYNAFEIIVVNDHSEDKTEEIVRDFRSSPFVKCIQNPGTGKKQAIASAVAIAVGDIIATTDGDCSIPSQWLSAVNNHIQGNIMMACGPVRIRGEGTLFSHMQQIEFASLIGASASGLGLRRPVMCNGANLAYRRMAFLETGGYEGNESIPSGDDEFLMRKIHQRFGAGSVAFMADEKAIVTTGPQPEMGAFLQQRLRWASKWRSNDSITTTLLAVFVFCVQVAAIYCMFRVVEDGSGLCILMLLLKAAVEAVLLRQFTSFLAIRWDWRAFAVLFVTYPFYVLAVGVAANVAGYTWRGRTFRRGKM